MNSEGLVETVQSTFSGRLIDNQTIPTPIGAHIHKGKFKTYDAARAAEVELFKSNNLMMGTCQVFVMGPQNVNLNFTKEAARDFGETPIRILVHNSYMVSLWNNDHSRRPFARLKIKEQLELCDIMNAAGFIIHLPDAEVQEIVDEMKHVTGFKTRIYLETKAQRPTAISYEKPERLNLLFTEMANIGLCVDTAHLWAAGVSLTTEQSVAKYLVDLSKCANLWQKDMLCFHLNDATHGFGTGKDEHANLTQGQIWGEDQSGLIKLVEFLQKCNIMTILERNKTTPEHDCKKIYEIIKGAD